MYSPEFALWALALIFGLYTAWNIGANDVANAMGTSVGSGALTLRRAVLVAAVMEFSGAFLAGSDVSQTVMRGIVNPEAFVETPEIMVYGMLAALLSAGVWLQLASYFGWPVSTTHSIIGAIVGFGAIAVGLDAIHWDQIAYIASSWILSPLMGGAIAFSFFTFLNRQIFYRRHPLDAAKKITPLLVFGFGIVLTLYILFKAFKTFASEVPMWELLLLSITVGTIAACITRVYVNRLTVIYRKPDDTPTVPEDVEIGLQKARKHLKRARAASADELRFQIGLISHEVKTLQRQVAERTREPVDAREYQAVERIFGYLQIVSACMMAFGHGANDVANAIGPLAAVLSILSGHATTEATSISPQILALGGFGIVLGLAMWGWRVIHTIGRKITELTPSRGFSAEFGAATTILLASRLGLPISTTHTLVGAVLGVGLARGISALNMNTVRDIVSSWLITIPAGAGLAAFFFYVLQFCFSG